MTKPRQRLLAELEAHRRQRRLPRYYLLAALTDLALYILFVAVPHRAMELGADIRQLGLIPVFWAVPYVLGTAFGGGLADRFSRGDVARGGIVIFGLAAAVLSRANSILVIDLGVAFVGVGLAGFWPALQAAIADASVHKNLERHLGTFNVAWSLGKGLGFLVGGALYLWIGAESTFALVAGVGFAVAMGMPRTPLDGRAAPSSLVAESGRSLAELRRFKYLGWIANFGIWGLGATTIHLFPELNHGLGRGATVFGLVVGTIYFAQTVAFAVLRRTTFWHYRVVPFLCMQALGAGSIVVLGLARPVALQLAAAVGLGASLGLAYYSSITYSLRTDSGRGKNTGRHEAALGSANFLLPLLGGELAARSGRAESPYLAAAAVVVLGLLVQTSWILLAARRGGSGS